MYLNGIIIYIILILRSYNIMDNAYISNIIDNFTNSLTIDKVKSAHMYAFKTKPVTNSSNKLHSLEYEFFDISMKKRTC